MLAWARRIVYRHWQRFHGVRRLELATLSRYLELAPGQRVLDVGSGKGAFCGQLARRGFFSAGVDPSLSALALARAHVDPAGRFLAGAGEDLPLAAGVFERAVSVCVLEHTRDDRRVLSEIHRALAPGSLFALSVDCLNSPHVSQAFRAHHVAEYRCNQLYDDAKLRELLEAAGFETLQTRYLFTGRLAVAILRWGSRFHYRGPFVLAFPLIYPFLWLDHVLGRRATSGMILAAQARKR
ncbi:MAG TPA: class I SAM-dependent methyltransferase [Thermoanaerobaculia bacterium]|nr:class I SAM-dependent methyltransferase [Thermoanaerobaculia bacterium]